MLVLIWTVVALALLAALYVALGGRAIFGTHERPARVIGRRVQLSQLESGPRGLDPQQPHLPGATIAAYDPADGYRLQFQIPFTWLGKTETEGRVSARHVGYPVSILASRWHRSVFVYGRFGSGEDFIGVLRLL